MNKELIYKYVNVIKDLNDEDYLKAVINYNVCPVIEGEKPASIITLGSYGRNLKLLWETYNNCIWEDEDIKWSVMRNTAKESILIIYRNSMLISLLMKPKVRKFFIDSGYMDTTSVEAVLFDIQKRYTKGCPHEIGALLGIPLEDVKDFIIGSKIPLITTGYWMVYNDVEEALRTFNLYDSLREKVISDMIKQIFIT